MFSEKLPAPITIGEGQANSFKDIVEYVYENYFKNNFMDKDKRNKLFGSFIYLDLNFIDYKPEKFWHIISFKPSEEKYTVNPCVNSNDLLLCESIKYSCYNNLCLPLDKRLKGRVECIYRLRRVNWINPIIQLANERDKSIKVWFEDEKDYKNKEVRKLYIRFQDGLADYLIILIDGSINKKKGYKFVTAYPVVHNGTKKNLHKRFKKYKEMI